MPRRSALPALRDLIDDPDEAGGFLPSRTGAGSAVHDRTRGRSIPFALPLRSLGSPSARRMKIVLFYHSLLSDWNHGNAHFLRGVATELIARGHEVAVYEPRDDWSLPNLRAEHGERAAARISRQRIRPERAHFYDLPTLDLDEALPAPISCSCTNGTITISSGSIGAHRARQSRYRLLFHDTHHRAVSAPDAMAGLRSAALRRRARLRRSAARTLSAATAGRSAPGPGTKRRTRAFFIRSRRSNASAIWSGSATGAMTNAAPSCASF